MADKKISELDQVFQINNDAAIPMSQDSGGTPTTYKAYITQIGAEIAEDQTFSNLQTTSKNLVGAINELNQGGGGGGASNANLAPDYDATSTYAVGDWCIYNGTLYQCNTAIPTAEAFDPTHWTAKKVVDAFADIEDELDDKVDKADYTATLLPIQSGSATNTKDYIDTNCLTVTSPSGVTRNTTTTSSGTFDVSKCGKLVTVNILEIVSSTVYGQNELVISGLPVPSTNQGFMLSNQGDQKAYRFRITTSGELRAWYNSPGVPSGASLYGFITYFTT